MKYKHIVFDIDGTLIDTEYAVLHSLQETIRALSGREIPCSELKFALGITEIDALKKLKIKDISYAIELWDNNMCKYADTIKVFDGITGLLENLLSLDYKLGIVTSETREEFAHDFCQFGISQYFKTIICADDTQEHKPNAEPLLKYVELSKTDHRKVLYIGDSKYDTPLYKFFNKKSIVQDFLMYNPIFDSLAKHNTSQSRYLQGLRGILVSF